MLVFRSVTTGLLGACLYFILQLPAQREPPQLQQVASSINWQRSIPVTVIDVAHGVPAMTVPSLVELAPGERIAAVDDQEVGNDLTAGAFIHDRARDGRFIDLTIERSLDQGAIDSATTTRRVLVLLH